MLCRIASDPNGSASMIRANSAKGAALEDRRRLCHRYVMGKTEVGGTPIVVVSSPGVRGRQRWVASVPVEQMVAEVRKRIPTDAIAELSDQRLSQQQAAKLDLRPGDVRLLD